MRHIHRQQVGLPADPWAALGHQPTADAARVALAVRAAVEARAFVGLLGPRGAGKTRALRAALAAHDGVRVVEPLRLTRERLHMGDIETALVRDLSDEPPRRSGEARSHQVRRVLGAASRSARVVLVIDDAHCLHGQTVRALKRLRELAWMGRAPLLGVVLVGQRDAAARVPEVGLRADALWLAGLAVPEAASAIRAVVRQAGTPPLLDADALAALATDRRARNWLDLSALLDECWARIVATGTRPLGRGDVDAVLRGRAPDAGPASAPPAPPSDAAVAAALARGRRAA